MAHVLGPIGLSQLPLIVYPEKRAAHRVFVPKIVSLFFQMFPLGRGFPGLFFFPGIF